MSSLAKRKDFVCTVCLHEQRTFSHPCDKCGSRKIEHVEFKRQQLGENWRLMMQTEKEVVN